MKLTHEGAEKESPEEILNNLVSSVQDKIPDFTHLPAELRSNLIDESVIILSLIESMCVNTFNSIAPTEANGLMLDQFGDSFGITRLKAEYATVMLTYSGSQGVVIPAGSVCQNSDGSQVFNTVQDVIVLENGKANVLGRSSESYNTSIPPNTITTMVSTIPRITSVTNLNEGTNGKKAETIDEFRVRLYRQFRTPRIGVVDYALVQLSALEGVKSRLISFNYGTKVIAEVITPAIQAVIGGGDDYQVAMTLFTSFLSPLLFISNPSDGDLTRKISVIVNFNDVDFNVEFTRPKISYVDININLTVISGSMPTPEVSIQQEIYTLVSNYIDNTRVGKSISKFSISKYIFDAINKMGFSQNIINNLDFTILIDGVEAELKDNRTVTPFDVAYTLRNISLRKIG